MRSCYPSALLHLCLVQGCERFAFFAMLPLFILYLHHRHGFTEQTALLILGLFNALSYLSGLPGGMLADRWLGPKRALIVATGALAVGYCGLASDKGLLLWPSLLLFVVGHGLFRPSMATLLGALDPSVTGRRDQRFLYQYFAINVAGVAGPFCAEIVSAGRDWPALFRLAATVMLVAACLLLASARRLTGSVAHVSVRSASSMSASDTAARWRAVTLLCLLAIAFWMTAIQAGASLVLFAESFTARHITLWGRSIVIGPTDFASLHALMVLVLLPFFVARSGRRRDRGGDLSAPAKLVWGYVATAAAFVLVATACLRGGDAGRVSPVWLVGCYALLSLSELLLSPFGLSLVTQLAPQNRTGQAIGLWFAMAGVGNVAAGTLGLLWGSIANHRYFALLALLSLVAAVALFSRLSLLDRLLSAIDADPKGGRS